MLTLDETTLFYFSLYSQSQSHKKGVINDWASNVASFDSGISLPKPKSKGGASLNSGVPSLTRASTLSSKSSALTDSITITDKKEGRPVSYSSHIGGLQDEDEAHGAERDAAASSPVKGKVRLSSRVIHFAIMWLNTDRVSF
jgi:hypothetical protein